MIVNGTTPVLPIKGGETTPDVGFLSKALIALSYTYLHPSAQIFPVLGSNSA